jgi:hypothetical protein
MAHPRRNQVFRDVGSSFHEPDDADFVEVIETEFDEQDALLLCSDGLSDMVPSATIEQTVRRHAGSPGRVVEALIQEANEAGGKDNVTAVYVEGSAFAQASRHGAESGEPLPAATTTRLGRLRTHPGAWLVAGLVAGLIIGAGVAWVLTRDTRLASGGRTLVVRSASAPATPETFGTIADALATAVPRDVVQVDPGEYAEAVVLPDGVSLRARIPGSVALVGRSGQAGWIALVAAGRLGHRISGIRVIGRPDARIGVGLQLTGHDIDVDDVSVEGVVELAFDIANDGVITVRASRTSATDGTPLRLGAGSRPTVRQNHFVHRAGARAAADIAPDATTDGVTDNLFIGYSEIVKGPPSRNAQLTASNIVLAGASKPATPGRRTP